MREALVELLDSWSLVAVWAAAVAVSLLVLLRDLKLRNPEIMGLMKVVWLFTVLYSGPLGLGLYWWAGRKQMAEDTLWTKAARSDAHCYSGCGAGEVIGVVITVGILALGNLWVSAVTFLLAYVMGFALTTGPLMQEGVPLAQAVKDALASETASITVMEIAAISVDLWLAPQATFGEAIFWSSLILSLSIGLLAAYPVNALLIRFGVKSGMRSPKELAEA